MPSNGIRLIIKLRVTAPRVALAQISRGETLAACAATFHPPSTPRRRQSSLLQRRAANWEGGGEDIVSRDPAKLTLGTRGRSGAWRCRSTAARVDRQGCNGSDALGSGFGVPNAGAQPRRRRWRLVAGEKVAAAVVVVPDLELPDPVRQWRCDRRKHAAPTDTTTCGRRSAWRVRHPLWGSRGNAVMALARRSMTSGTWPAWWRACCGGERQGEVVR
uniref:Uncharacterized protein n=1 Tax=Oryza meridionalis TaxID=40149 RepID=A0A0E0C5K4_9ORYZ